MAKIGYAQYDVHFGEYDRNAKTVKRLAEEGREADLLVFPELGMTGYEFLDAGEVERFAEPAGAGPTAAILRELAHQFQTTLVLGYPEYTTAGCYNASMLVTPDGGIHNYRKIHLFSREKELFLPGDKPPAVVETPVGRIGVMICFDWLFPETARILALQQAQVIAHPSNLVLNFCQKAMFCRSIENAVFIVTANRVGKENRAGRTLQFTGQSQVVSPAGKYEIKASRKEEALGVVEVDVAEADDKQITEFNHRFEDRRVELYDELVMGEAAEIDTD